MPLSQPNLKDYQDSAEVLGSWFYNARLDYVLYGSLNHPAKLRPGLSDIDVFVHKEDTSLLFPIQITEAFGEVRSKIEAIGIPLQINWTTSGQLQSPAFNVDESYLTEVRRGLSSMYRSQNIERILSNNRPVDPIDDHSMLRYFRRKIIDMGWHLHQTSAVLIKNPQELDQKDQKILWSLWDELKKTVSLIALAIRIKTGESYFSVPDSELINRFLETFSTEKEGYAEYIQLLKSIRSITEWYEFLKEEGNREHLRNLYNQTLNTLVQAISRGIPERNA